MTELTIRPATRPETGAVAGLIGTAFQYLGVSAWLVPDPEQRAAVLSRNFEIFVDYALTYGVVEVVGDLVGASVWLPLDGAPLPPPDDYDARLEAACGVYADNFRELDALFDAHHPHEPHHHLAFLAVRADHQSRGIGSALIDHYHRRLDATGTAGFLEASSTGARDLYARHGYVPMGEAYPVPNGALFYPMWRAPRT
jgi:ribosomal protein S18 acetylase RimI-like enzyme